MLSEILDYAIKHNCSDVHLRAAALPMIRFNGELYAIPNSKIFSDQQVAAMLDGLMSDSQKNIFKTNLELDFTIQFSKETRFRVSAFFTIHGPAACFRIISDKIRNLESIATPTIVNDLIKAKKGLILVTGPTGSGKSTTLAAMIDHLNSNQRYNIITIEDPVEFVHSNKKSLISQREIGHDTLSFQNALRSALRENPDVILVGELRDLETIQLALTAAETGHLVLATLHTNSAWQAVDRIIDVFNAQDKESVRTLLAGSLHAVISQRLLKTVDNNRCAAYEILIATSSIRNMIRENKVPQIQSIMEINKKQGMILLKDSILELLSKGRISQEVADDALKANE